MKAAVYYTHIHKQAENHAPQRKQKQLQRFGTFTFCLVFSANTSSQVPDETNRLQDSTMHKRNHT